MEQRKRRRSVSELLQRTKFPKSRAEIMAQWSENITRRTDDLLNLAFNAHLAGDSEGMNEHLRELSRFIRQSMGAVPNITRILQGEKGKDHDND